MKGRLVDKKDYVALEFSFTSSCSNMVDAAVLEVAASRLYKLATRAKIEEFRTELFRLYEMFSVE